MITSAYDIAERMLIRAYQRVDIEATGEYFECYAYDLGLAGHPSPFTPAIGSGPTRELAVAACVAHSKRISHIIKYKLEKAYIREAQRLTAR
jgi:hypothetical protein